jgi:hypothetical protein
MNDAQVRQLLDELKVADPYESIEKASQLAEILPHAQSARRHFSESGRETAFARRVQREEVFELRPERRSHSHDVADISRLEELIRASGLAVVLKDDLSKALENAAASISSPTELVAAIKAINAAVDEAKPQVDAVAALAVNQPDIMVLLEEIRARQAELEKLMLSIKNDERRWRETVAAALRTLTP